MTARDVIATAIKEETDTFQNPVGLYVDPEAAHRYDGENGSGEHCFVEKDWSAESWLIIADAVVARLKAAGYSIVHESEIHGATRDRCAVVAKSFGDTWSGSRDVSVCVQEAAVDQKVDEIVAAIRALPDGGVECGQAKEEWR